MSENLGRYLSLELEEGLKNVALEERKQAPNDRLD